MKTIVLVSFILQLFLLIHSTPIIENNIQRTSPFKLKIKQHNSSQIINKFSQKINQTKFKEKFDNENDLKVKLFDNELKLQLHNRIKKNVIPSATVICYDTNSNNGYNMENCNNLEGQQILTIPPQGTIQVPQNPQQNIRGLLINCLLPQNLFENLQSTKITQVPVPQQQSVNVWNIPNDLGSQAQFPQEVIYQQQQQQQPQQLQLQQLQLQPQPQSTVLCNPQTNNFPINGNSNLQPGLQINEVSQGVVQNCLTNEGPQFNSQGISLQNAINSKTFLNCLFQAMQNNGNQNNQQTPQGGGGLQNPNQNGIFNNQLPQQQTQQQFPPNPQQSQFSQSSQFQQQFPSNPNQQFPQPPQLQQQFPSNPQQSQFSQSPQFQQQFPPNPNQQFPQPPQLQQQFPPVPQQPQQLQQSQFSQLPQFQQQFPQQNQQQFPPNPQQFPQLQQQYQQNFPPQGYNSLPQQPNSQGNRGFPFNLNPTGNQNNKNDLPLDQLNRTSQEALEAIQQRNFGRNFNSRTK
ncbi:putative uncharacterized protein DDB_G0271606 [Leptopilina heterotoma]|uniref:putative uncharacterized protein DDB_G0271606 n=1 Tax=Leptopilina heterotoma TaxID=63436 RepID=UPI001CA93886|nr:putative uncharacterized protein DDB_G0271606 [Leptopilina heterotoma]